MQIENPLTKPTCLAVFSFFINRSNYTTSLSFFTIIGKHRTFVPDFKTQTDMKTTNAMLNQFNDSIADRKVLESNNSILVIQPRFKGGLWVFDDQRTGLVDEPFIAGADDFIEYMLSKLGYLPSARAGFTAVFSTLPFPGYQACLVFQSFKNMGSVYLVENDNKFRNKSGNGEVWLCPALNLYFRQSPQNLFIQFRL